MVLEPIRSPSRFQRLWNQVKRVVEGGFPYSEGIYEDINKAVVVQFYWDRDRTAQPRWKNTSRTSSVQG